MVQKWNLEVSWHIHPLYSEISECHKPQPTQHWNQGLEIFFSWQRRENKGGAERDIFCDAHRVKVEKLGLESWSCGPSPSLLRKENSPPPPGATKLCSCHGLGRRS